MKTLLKITALLLALIMMLGAITACNSASSETTEATDTESESSTDAQATDKADLSLFPENALRQGGDLFLDDMSPDELSERLGVPVAPGHNDGAQLIRDILSVRDAAQKR